MRRELIREHRTHNPLSGKPIKVRRPHLGAIGKLHNAHIEQMDGEGYESLFGNMFGRIKAKRDAKASKKVRKAGTMTAKERRASKLKSKNLLRKDKGTSKKMKAKSKIIKSEKGGGKVGDTLNKAMELGTEFLASRKQGEAEETEQAEPKEEKTFMQKNGMALGIAAVVLIVIVLIIVFKPKK